jgi:multidrug efflux pump subunit AcrB
MIKKIKSKDNPLVRMADFFFVRWRYTLLLWAFLLGSGVAIYTSFIPREGFPPIQFPVSVVTGTYIVNDKDKVDSELSKPLFETLKDVEGISKITSTSNDNFITSIVFFEDNVAPDEGAKSVEDAISSSTILPEQVKFDVLQVDPAAFLNEFDLLLSVYNTETTDTVKLQEVAENLSKKFTEDSKITNAETQKLIQEGQNPLTGQSESIKSAFNLIVLPNENGELTQYPAITIGIDRDSEQIDILELSELANQKISELDLSQYGEGYKVVIGADFASSINAQVNSLQSNLLSGLVAVAIVTFLLISWRASIITGIFMVTVMAVTVLVLYLVGYTLNTITLFALVLSLGLFVDDATIVVESIYAHRSKKRSAREIVHQAVKKISGASFAGTMTTVLVFLPLAFLSGILGEFIRLMPITVIIALISSLVLSLVLIPVLSKFILLKHTTDGWITRHNPIVRLEAYLAKFVSVLPRTLKTNPRAGKLIMVSMIGLSAVMFILSLSFASKLSFNIFPPSKDSDQLGLQISYPDGYTVEQAQEAAMDINDVVVEEIGTNVERITYGTYQESNARSADGLIELVSFNQRDIKSPELIERIQNAANSSVPEGVGVRVIQYDAGPPASQFPLTVQVYEEDSEKALKLATEIRDLIDGTVLTRANGTTATIVETQNPTVQSIERRDNRRTLVLKAAFDADDTSALLAASEELISEKFTNEYLESNGYSADSIGFDFGQESDNADSFSSLAYAFPIAILLMFILLAVQFRSLLQPLLIFMAIPFTFFGVFAGLYFTDNSLSFFVQVGLIGLIGIAVNNTILLTEYANQEKREGVGTIDAISNAVQKRFRPLITTTLTTVVALLPLALSDPFWEALAFTIIFGLISSTILVIFSFPYYYLIAEKLRTLTSRAVRKLRKA